MKASEKLEYLTTELGKVIKSYEHKQNWDRIWSYSLKILTTFLAAAITVLLGLKLPVEWTQTVTNLALALGGTITLISAADAFLDLRSLWAQRQATLSRLYVLRREMDFYKSGLDDQNKEFTLTAALKLNDRFIKILRDELKN
jgi:hypothetical protein